MKLRINIIYSIEKIKKTFIEYFGVDDAIALLMIIIGSLFYWKNGPLPFHQGWHNLYENIHSDLIGIGIGVLIIGNAEQFLNIKLAKRRLILQMASPDNGFAIEAVRQLRALGWLGDGTLNGADLIGANLSEADLGEASMEGSFLNKACLDDVNLGGANLKDAKLFKASMKRAVLYQTDLENADLKRVNFEGSKLIWVTMRGANLLGARLKRVKLRGVNFEGANLQMTDLEGSSFDVYTTWPEGFMPESAGAMIDDLQEY